MPTSALLIASYILLAVFAVAFVVRSLRLARMPVHLRWELAPVPHERSRNHYGGSYFEEYEWWTKPREKSLVSELSYMLQEILLLKAVREHNRRLWWFSFPFHLGLYLLATAVIVLLVLVGMDLLGAQTGGWTAAATGIAAIAGAGCALGAVGAVGLLAKRIFDPDLADFTTPASLVNLALLLVLFASGALAVAGPAYVPGMSAYLRALLTAGTDVALPAALTVHLVVALVFLAYLPFTPMMHFVAKYFTYHEVRWNDEPMEPGSRMEREVQALLGQPVTWAAPHLGADGRKNWVDLATEETKR